MCTPLFGRYVLSPLRFPSSMPCCSKAASEHSPDVALKTPPAKRTLMQQVEDSSSGSNKKQRKTCRGEIVQNTPVSNQKRDQCELCHEKRSSDQRGAYCELCVKAFRKQTGHQRIAACKDDASLMDRVIEFSKTLRGNKPQGAAQSRKSFRARMADIERMLGLLLAHFDLKWQCEHCHGIMWGGLAPARAVKKGAPKYTKPSRLGNSRLYEVGNVALVHISLLTMPNKKALSTWEPCFFPAQILKILRFVLVPPRRLA